MTTVWHVAFDTRLTMTPTNTTINEPRRFTAATVGRTTRPRVKYIFYGVRLAVGAFQGAFISIGNGDSEKYAINYEETVCWR